jgi:hypothetical protein
VINREIHDVTKECVASHCHIHHVDEPGVNAYRVCFECGHVYQTASDLRRAYRKAIRDMKPKPGKWISDEWGWGWLAFWRRFLTVQARNITFCQECIHDW